MSTRVASKTSSVLFTHIRSVAPPPRAARVPTARHMALAPGAYRAPERAPARDGRDAPSATVAFDPAHRAATPAIAARDDADRAKSAITASTATRARRNARRDAATPRARRRRRPTAFEMDLDAARGGEASGRSRSGARFAARAASCCQEGCYPHKDRSREPGRVRDCGRRERDGVRAEVGRSMRRETTAVERRETGRVLVGVFDGHGKHGEECAQIARATFAETLARETRGGAALRDGYARTFERGERGGVRGDGGERVVLGVDGDHGAV